MVIKSTSENQPPGLPPEKGISAQLILSRGYQEGILRLMPQSLDDITEPLSHDQIQEMPSISVETLNKLLKVSDELQEKIQEYLLPEIEQLVYQHLANVDFIVVSEISGSSQRTRLGLSQLGSPKAIYLALNYLQQPRDNFVLTSTFWHELTHIANPRNDKIDPYRYLAAFLEVRLNSTSKPDPATDYAIKDIRESVPRAFQGALFGTPICPNPHWRQHYQPVVELVEGDQLTLFSPNSNPEE